MEGVRGVEVERVELWGVAVEVKVEGMWGCGGGGRGE